VSAVVGAGSVSTLLAIANIALCPSNVHNENVEGSTAIRSLDGRIHDAVDLVAPPASNDDRVAAFDTLNRRERLQYQRISRKKLRGPLDDAGRVRFRQLRSEALSVRVTIVRHSKVA
jgi:hypothetical protein